MNFNVLHMIQETMQPKNNVMYKSNYFKINIFSVDEI